MSFLTLTLVGNFANTIYDFIQSGVILHCQLAGWKRHSHPIWVTFFFFQNEPVTCTVTFLHKADDTGGTVCRPLRILSRDFQHSRFLTRLTHAGIGIHLKHKSQHCKSICLLQGRLFRAVSLWLVNDVELKDFFSVHHQLIANQDGKDVGSFSNFCSGSDTQSDPTSRGYRVSLKVCSEPCSFLLPQWKWNCKAL